LGPGARFTGDEIGIRDVTFRSRHTGELRRRGKQRKITIARYPTDNGGKKEVKKHIKERGGTAGEAQGSAFLRTRGKWVRCNGRELVLNMRRSTEHYEKGARGAGEYQKRIQSSSTLIKGGQRTRSSYRSFVSQREKNRRGGLRKSSPSEKNV